MDIQSTLYISFWIGTGYPVHIKGRSSIGRAAERTSEDDLRKIFGGSNPTASSLVGPERVEAVLARWFPGGCLRLLRSEQA
jgi:hypothetical protein